MLNTNHKKKIQIIGYASCIGAQDHRCETGPLALQNLQLTTALNNANFDVEWTTNISSAHEPKSKVETLSIVTDNCKELARHTKAAVASNKQIVVIGGDHSCAIGTWSGVYSAIPKASRLGLIWVDAHMDSHTITSSPSGAIHGMPVAILLGHGDPKLTSIESKNEKIKPECLCLVGVRSYESEEANLLNKLGVKIFYMKDIETLGLNKVMALAKAQVAKHSTHYGISLDLDVIDPVDAPGVGSREAHGISGKGLIKALANCHFADNFIGIEITELNSSRDHVDKTARLAIEAILACLSQPSEKT